MKLKIIKEYQQGETGTEICLAHINGDWIASFGKEGNKEQEEISDEIWRRVNLHEELSELKTAIEARICGVWDNPALEKLGGPLDVDPAKDILRMIQEFDSKH